MDLVSGPKAFRHADELNLGRIGTSVGWGFKTLDLKDIAAVEIQAQDLRQMVVVPVRTSAE